MRDFRRFLIVDQQLSKRTVSDYTRIIRKLLSSLNKSPHEITEKDIRDFLESILNDGASPYTYANYLKSLRVFFIRYLKRAEIIAGFRFPPRDIKPNHVPTKDDLRRFYDAIPDLKGKAVFLLFATSGLRRSEILSLHKEDVDLERRIIHIRKGNSRTKRVFTVGFFNDEAAAALRAYIENMTSREKRSSKLFPMAAANSKRLWAEARDRTGLNITPQVLRKWFATEMARLGVPDRYVDALQGRVPKSVLARHYTDYSPDRLREIYDGAHLRVLS